MASQGKFVWYDLMTTDTAAAAAFYNSVVGWTAKDYPEMNYTVFEVPGAPAGAAGLMPLPEELRARGVPPCWNGYVYVDDVDASARAFAENGGAIRKEAQDIPGVGRFAVVQDPHGAVLLVFKPAPMDNPPPEPGQYDTGYVGWNELYAGNGEEAFDFYSKMFGWTKDTAMPMGEMGVYQLFAHEGTAIGGMMTKMPDMPAPFWSYYFNVEALDAAVERVNTGGGQVVNGPMEVPGGAWIVNCMDPQGAFFSLVSMKR